MKIPALALLAFLPFPLFSQVANQATLTLVEEDGSNEVDIEIEISLGEINLPSKDTSTLRGTIDVELNIAPRTAKTDEFTILSADVTGSEIDLSAEERVFILVVAEYNIKGTGLGFSAETTDAPGAVDPETGEFDASDHAVTVDRGLLDVTAESIALDDDIEVTYNFEEAPFTGAGAGTGTITITPGRKEGIRQYYHILMDLPIRIDQEIELEDIDIADLSVKGDIAGTIQAVGETFLDIPDYEWWAGAAGVTPDSQDEFSLSPSIPNYLLFALGHDGSSLPGQLFSVTSDGVTLKTAGDFALGGFTIEWSEDLENWSPVPQSAMTSGSSSISFGDSFELPTTIEMEASKKYFRLAPNPSN